MNFLNPVAASIAAAIVIPALVALYFLKLRRKQVVIASTLLWKKAVQDLQVNAPFQRLRRNLLLLLQLLLLAALLLAMARPTTTTTAAPGQRVALLIDHSASMNAADAPAGARLDEAKSLALDLIGNLNADGGGDDAPGGAMVVSFAQQARVVQPFTGDVSLLRAAVRSIEPTDQRSNLAAALRLIEPFALQAAAEQAGGEPGLVVYVLSDGRVHQASGPLALPGAKLHFLPIGEAETGNVAIVSSSARRDLEKPEIVQLFARVANYGPQPVETNVTLRIDGRAQQVEPVALPPRGEEGSAVRSLQFDFVLPESGVVEVSHDRADALPADDAARLVLAPARRLRVLLVTEGNAFLQRVLESVGVRDLVLMSPEKYENQDPEALRRGGWDTAGTTASVAQGFDVIVFDRYAARGVPPVSSLTFGAAPPIEGLSIVRSAPADAEPDAGDAGEAGDAASAPAETVEPILDWERDHPLLRYVVLDDVLVQDAGRLVVPADATVLAVGQRGPILAEVRAEGRRHVVTSFDILRSNWPLYVSFPVFVSNSVQTLGLGGLADAAGVAYATGQVAAIPADELDRVTYAGPVELEARVVNGQAVLPMFRRVGLYEAQQEAIEPPFDRLAVNLLDPVESDLRPVETLEVGSIAAQGQARDQTVRREVWHWFAWGALAMLMIEWLVYTRRMHL